MPNLREVLDTLAPDELAKARDAFEEAKQLLIEVPFGDCIYTVGVNLLNTTGLRVIETHGHWILIEGAVNG